MGADRKHVLVDDLADLYPSRNRAAVSLAWSKTGEELRVRAKPVAVTSFDALLVAVDGKPARRLPADFRWRLHPGVNTLAVRTRNKPGAMGHPFRITLWKDPR
jgi:hypothetical protein